MGLYSTISINEVITRTKLQLRIFDNSQDDFLQILIYEGLNNLDILSAYIKKQTTLCVSDGKAKLPCDFNKLLAAVTKVLNTVGNRDIFTERIYIDRPFLKTCDISCNDNFHNFSDVMQINAGYLFVGGVEEIEIAYLGLNEDNDGNPLIYAHYERALMNYACYMFMMSFNENYNQYLIDKHNRTWVAQKNKLRGGAVREDAENTRYQIKKIFNALTLNPYAYVLNSF